jgi:hypothetical protein
MSADVFDTLDLTSFVYRGIGAGDDWECLVDGAVPLCVHGQACEADAGNRLGLVSAELYRVGITRDINDRAVLAINNRCGRPLHARVDFLTEYAPHLNIVRA